MNFEHLIQVPQDTMNGYISSNHSDNINNKNVIATNFRKNTKQVQPQL
jgi:hypothetical protein